MLVGNDEIHKFEVEVKDWEITQIYMTFHNESS